MAPYNSSDTQNKADITHTTSPTHHKKAFNVPGKPFTLYSTLPYYMIYIFYAIGIYTILWLHNPFYVLALIYFVVPIFDFFNHDWLNPTKEQLKDLQKDNFWFKLPLYGLIVLDNLIFFFALYLLTTREYSLMCYIGTIFTVGSIAGHNFLVSHELIHKRGLFDRLFGTITILKSLYMHFYIEHNFGHHKNIGTFKDPATARYRESIYRFLPRTIFGSFISAWEIEKKRTTKRKGYKTQWNLENKMIWFTLCDILVPFLIYKWLGWKGLILFAGFAIWSFFVFEAVNYIEHYGLTRQEIAPGEYEKVNVTHSWNGPQRFSNYLLFKLQRHSDHHENSYKPYQQLISKDESPMLPHGYLLSILMAFFPPIWFRMMDRVLLAYKENRSLTEQEQKLTRWDTWVVFCALGLMFTVLIVLAHLDPTKF